MAAYLLLVHELGAAGEQPRPGRHDVQRAPLQARVRRRGRRRRSRRCRRACSLHTARMALSAECARTAKERACSQAGMGDGTGAAAAYRPSSCFQQRSAAAVDKLSSATGAHAEARRLCRLSTQCASWPTQQIRHRDGPSLGQAQKQWHAGVGEAVRQRPELCWG